MSVFDKEIDEAEVMEIALVNNNIANYRTGKAPYIGSMEDSGATRVSGHFNSMLFDPKMVHLKGSILHLRAVRNAIFGQIDWKKYDIQYLRTSKTLIIEQCHDLPECIYARTLYLNGLFDQIRNFTFRGTTLSLYGSWVGSDSGFYDVHIECESLYLSDCPRHFNNLTGKCNKITISVFDFDNIPALAESVIPQTINGKKIKKVKDVRAYFNNPKKYPTVSPDGFFDIPGFIAGIGLDKLEELRWISIEDCGIKMDFRKPTDTWICASIEPL